MDPQKNTLRSPMHPVLMEIPLPSWDLPWTPLLLFGAAFGLVLAVFGHRQKVWDLLWLGVGFAAVGSVLAFVFKGARFRLSPVPVYSYGALLSVSLVLGWFLALRLARLAGLPSTICRSGYFVAVLSALVGARAAYVLTNPAQFAAAGAVFDLGGGGLVAYGGFLGGLLGSVVYFRVRRVGWLGWGDAAAPSLALGLLVTRVGCYLYGCDFGTPLGATAPGWLRRAGTFPRWQGTDLLAGSGSPAWLQHVAERGLSPDATVSLPVHPTQLYEALAGGLLLAGLLWLWPRRRFRGQVLLTFALAYGGARFGLEVLRDDPERGLLGPRLGVQTSVSAALLLLGAGFALGPARSIRSVWWRRVASAAGLWPAIAAFFLLRPEPFQAPATAPLSTSQWIALLTGIGACAAWRPLERRSMSGDGFGGRGRDLASSRGPRHQDAINRAR